MASRKWTFSGRILGAGTGSGVRVVVGMWDDSPLGAFADVVVERAGRQRLLLAPSEEVRDFVAGTYSFDTTRVEPVGVTCGDGQVVVRTPSLELTARLGRRTPLGHLLRLVPERLASRPLVASVTAPAARLAPRRVRTRGSAGGGRPGYPRGARRPPRPGAAAAPRRCAPGARRPGRPAANAPQTRVA